jgi:3-oxoacyl-[acyl-carrier-protein] synthase-3
LVYSTSGIQAVSKRLNIPEKKVIISLADHGNTSAASIPLALDQSIREGKIKTGDTVLLQSFGAGFTWGTVIIKI